MIVCSVVGNGVDVVMSFWILVVEGRDKIIGGDSGVDDVGDVGFYGVY